MDDTLTFCRQDGVRMVSFDGESDTVSFGDQPMGAKVSKTGSRPRRSGRSVIESIAVLPFENGSSDPNAEYLSDGMTEIIINNLSQLPKLKVMARSTVFRYKGRQIDPEQIGRQLGVRAVATGRVQQLGDHLTIGVELVDTGDGSLLWGERYSRKMDDIFSLQEDIAAQISANLRLRVSRSHKKRLRKPYTTNGQAYQLYLKGRYFWNKRTADNACRGIDHFQQALDLDPQFALAYAGIADCQTLLGDVGVQATPPIEAFLQGQRSAQRALELDDAVPEAHGTLGHISMHLFNWSGAEKQLRRALELNPNYAQAGIWYAYFLAFTGRVDDSVAAIINALQLDPLSPPVNRSAGELLFFAGRFGESIDRFEQAIEMDSHYVAHLELGRVYEHLERFEPALEQFAKARELSNHSAESLASMAHCCAVSGKKREAQNLLIDLKKASEDHYVSPYDLALVHKALAQHEECFRLLNRAYEIHDGWMIYITVDFRWKDLRADPRFIEVVRRMGLPQSISNNH